MLDDLSFIHRIDKADALGIAAKEPGQLIHNFGFSADLAAIDNVVYTGMGGSALAASLSLTWPGFKVPFEIVRDYNLPSYVSKKTLCIVSSYSGNTEETLSSLSNAEQKGAQIVVITGGGELLRIAQEKGYPVALMPQAKQPRYAVFYNLKALIEIGINAGILADDRVDVLTNSAGFLKEKLTAWLPDSPTKDNLAKQIALDCVAKSVVVYGGPKMAPVAYKWKISFNENAKHVAWTGVYSEFNHNEFMGWSSQPVDKPYCVIDLRSSLEHPQIAKRFELSDRLLSGRRPAPIVVHVEGENVVEQMLYGVLLGDFVSLYSAIAAEIDPEPVELIEKFKVMLNQ